MSRICGCRSSTSVRTPAGQSSQASIRPVGPAPTMIASASITGHSPRSLSSTTAHVSRDSHFRRFRLRPATGVAVERYPRQSAPTPPCAAEACRVDLRSGDIRELWRRRTATPLTAFATPGRRALSWPSRPLLGVSLQQAEPPPLRGFRDVVEDTLGVSRQRDLPDSGCGYDQNSSQLSRSKKYSRPEVMRPFSISTTRQQSVSSCLPFRSALLW